MKPILRHLCQVAAREAGITEQEIYSSRRFRRFAWPRFAVMAVAHENGRSFPLIAQHLGMAEHTSVMHGCRKAAALERVDPAFASLVAKLREAVFPAIHTDPATEGTPPNPSTCGPTHSSPHIFPQPLVRSAVEGA